MTKRALSLFLALILCLGLAAPALAAGEVVQSGYCGGEGDGTNLSWTLTDNGVLTISGTGKMKDFIDSGPWSFVSTEVETVDIQEGVTTVGREAFHGCEALTSVTLPEGLTTIGDHAFDGCEALTGVTFPEGVTTIGDWAFDNCWELTDITIPASVDTIGDHAFDGCDALTHVTFLEGVTTIGRFAFRQCAALNSVTIPASVDTIGESAFYGCDALTHVTLLEGVTTIGEGAFERCDALTNVTIPASVTTIGEGAFVSCDALTSFSVAEGNPAYTAVDGVLFNKDKTTLIRYPVGNARTTYSIPDSVTTIGDMAFAFEECVTLTNVTIPASVTAIGRDAFSGSSLAEAQISVRFLGNAPQIDDHSSPFYHCSLTVYYPEGNSTWTDEAKERLANGAANVTWIPFDVSAFQPATYTVIVWSAQHGKVTATPTSATAGTKVALTIAPDKGYGLDTLVVKQMDGTVVPVINNTFTMPASDVTITPTFKATTYTVTVWSAQHGKVTASPKESTAGTKVTLTVTPDKGYELDTLIVKQMDGTVVPVTNNTFTMPAADVTITPTFKELPPETYTVTVSNAQHGKVTASPNKGTAGTKVKLTVTPDNGYELDTLTVKQTSGKTVAVAKDNTFEMPASNVTVSATFKALPVDRLSLSRSSVSVSVGSSVAVSATVSGYAGKHVYAISSDTSVATVSVSGKTVRVQGVAQGAASVYVVMADTNAMTLDQAKADPSMKELKVTVTKAGSSGGGSSGGGGGGGGASGGSSGGSAGGSTSTTPTTPESTTPASQTFGDVEKGSWYESGVTFVVSKGLFNGVGDGAFAPQQNMTRAMLMTVLARLDGQSTDGGATWYSKGMDWAKAQGISDGTAPEGNITREQLVTMLYRYAKSPAADGGLDDFADVAAISDWAADAMRWAVQNGILTGKGDARLDPQGLATRAEVATILQRYVEKLGQ